MHALDDLDLSILSKLESNAKITLLELARQLGAPRSTIRERIQRLERSGVIKGYTAVIDPGKLGFGIKVMVQVTRDQRVTMETYISEMISVPEVTHVQLISGETDELVTIYVRDVDHLRDVLYNKIGSLPGVMRTSTAVVLYEQAVPFTSRYQATRKGGNPR